MAKMRVLRGLGVDLGIWFLAPAVFLFVYVGWFAFPTSAAFAHLRLVLLLFIGFLAIRLFLHRMMPNRTEAVLAASILATAVLAFLIGYYALVIVGLSYWARVISWDLIEAYSRQLPAFADALGVSLGLCIAMLILALVALFAATMWYFLRNDWPEAIPEARKPLLLALIPAALCGVALEAYLFTDEPPNEAREPFALTLYPLAYDMQGHGVDKVQADRLNVEEDRARAAYVVSPGSDRKNLVVFVVDALRDDHLGLLGYPRDTTPNLARMASSVTVRKAGIVHSSCADSWCGLMSLASSRFVHQFATHPFTLQAVLKRNGYRVHLVLGGDHTNFYGLRKVYGEVDSYFDGASQARRYFNDDELMLDRLAEFPSWDGAPTMFQFHLMSVHTLGTRYESSNKFLPTSNYTFHKGEASEALNYYDNGVAQADMIIGRMLALLAEKGYLKNTLVMITGDHGEGLGEHGSYGHAKNVFEESLRIPVVFLSFGYRPTSRIDVRSNASQVDIAPSILKEFDIPRPATWAGVPLQDPQGPDFTYFQEKVAAGLFDHRDPMHLWKYFVNTESGREAVFDLSTDPEESVNRGDAVSSALSAEWRAKTLPTYGNRLGVVQVCIEHRSPPRRWPSDCLF